MGHMSGPPGIANAWIRKYIFPGGYIPALSEVIPAIERAGLWITDIEILRLHYAETLRHWRERFNANREQVRKLYDERFCRMWEFYLICSELIFRRQDAMVFHIQLAKKPDAVPLTRDYLWSAQRDEPSSRSCGQRNRMSQAKGAVDLAFRSFGEGPPVVILHGLLGSSRNWQALGKALADQQLYRLSHRCPQSWLLALVG